MILPMLTMSNPIAFKYLFLEGTIYSTLYTNDQVYAYTYILEICECSPSKNYSYIEYFAIFYENEYFTTLSPIAKLKTYRKLCNNIKVKLIIIYH